jgi:mono/diheme cytochrome c family protein
MRKHGENGWRSFRMGPGLRTGWAAVAFSVACLLLAHTAQGEPTPGELEFYETKIRPLLAQHCYECHSEQKTQAGLRLDRAQGWLTGGDSGPALVPGEPGESLLIRALRHEGADVEMPPAGKLSDDAIGLIETWVARGAPAPADATVLSAARREIDLEAGREFWSYRPVADPVVPEVAEPEWSLQPVDRFIYARLTEAGLVPQARAERGTLIRRLYFDLWGLPPTPEEIAAFEQSSDAAAYEQLVDRLLASPHFGERFARHWLDVVRYAQSVTLRGFVLPEAWRYRDYVIESFERDRPFDQFLREQLAGDLLQADSIEQRQRQQIATTFLTLGNTNLEEQDKLQLDMDVVDEQIDVIGKGMLGQTIACARCHDHKFDPIPTRDYYALAGILRNVQVLEHANVSKWLELPLALPPDQEAEFAAQEAELAALNEQVEAARKQVKQLARLAPGGTPVDGVVDPAGLVGVVVDDRQAKKVGAWQESRSVKPHIGTGYVHDENGLKGEKTLTFAPELPQNGRYEIRLAYTARSNRAERVPVTVFSADGERTLYVNMRETPPIDQQFVSLGEYRCETAGQTFVLVANEGTEGHVVADAVQFLPRDTTTAATETTVASAGNGPSPELLAAQKALKELEQQLKQAKSSAPPRPRVMSIAERPQIEDIPVHVRGSVHTLGEMVPRGFLQVIGGAAPSLPGDQSGRFELAKWITSPENPLTARVYVNRVWQALFGAGIVRSTDNFGTTGELPSHPELLDYLARQFQGQGWSVKQLVRSLVLTRTYQLDSAADDNSRRIDPENRLLAHANRRRLDAESLRDAILSISGQLDRTMGGPNLTAGTSSDYDYRHDSLRRSVYLPVLRNSLPDLFEAFDFPDPSLVVGTRNVTTVTPQALFLMNHPWVRGQAGQAAQQLLAADLPDDAARIDWAFCQSLGRHPTEAERQVAIETVTAGDWTDLYHLLWMSLDFRYRD